MLNNQLNQVASIPEAKCNFLKEKFKSITYKDIEAITIYYWNPEKYPEEKTETLSKIAAALFCKENVVTRGFWVDKIIHEYKIPAKELKTELKKIVSSSTKESKSNANKGMVHATGANAAVTDTEYDENEDDKEETETKYINGKNVPLIVQVEKFLNNKFEFRRNEVNERIERREKNPITEWGEANPNSLSRLLEHNYFKYARGKVEALLLSDFVPSYNPFIEYFNNLPKFDPVKESSSIDLLVSCIKVKNQGFFNLHFRKALIRCIACSLVTGKINTILISRLLFL